MRSSLSSRLAGLYTLLLGITVFLVIVASSIALIYELTEFSRDIIIAKHDEARNLAEQYHFQGVSLSKAAPEIARELQGIGLQVAVFDSKGRYLAGDKSLRPPMLARIVQGGVQLIERSPSGPTRYRTIPLAPPGPLVRGSARPGSTRSFEIRAPFFAGAPPGARTEGRFLISVDGGGR